MHFRRVLVLGLASAGALLAFGSSSCTIVDPQEIDFEAKPTTSAIGEDGSTSSGGEGGSTEGGGGDSSLEGGEASGPITAFSGALPYDSATAGMTTGSNNNNASHAGFNPQNNPAGQECLTCHKSGSAVGAIEFAYGATLFQQAAGTAAFTTHAEVRIVDSKGALVAQSYVDELGNFWTDAVAGGIPAGSHVGVRNGTIMKLMNTTLGGPADGDCAKSTCHAAGGAAGGKIFLQ